MKHTVLQVGSGETEQKVVHKSVPPVSAKGTEGHSNLYSYSGRYLAPILQ